MVQIYFYIKIESKLKILWIALIKIIFDYLTNMWKFW